MLAPRQYWDYPVLFKNMYTCSPFAANVTRNKNNIQCKQCVSYITRQRGTNITYASYRSTTYASGARGNLPEPRGPLRKIPVGP